MTKSNFWRIAALLFAAFSMVGFASCSDDETESREELKVSVIEGGVSYNSITVTITSANADKCSYTYYKADAAQPSVEEIFAGGTAVTPNTTATPTIENLEPETEYVVIVAAAQGSLTKTATLNVTTPVMGDKVIYLERLEHAEYASIGNNLGDYYIALSTHELINGQPPVGGMLIYLQMINDEDSDPLNAILPDGTYTTNNETEKWALVSSGSYAIVRVDDTENGTLMGYLMGDVVVKREGGTYTLTMDFTMPMFDNLAFEAEYTGPIGFVDKTVPPTPVFTTEQNVTFTSVGDCRYFGSWFYPHADDMNLYFLATEGSKNYRLAITSLYVPLLGNIEKGENVRIPEGVYNVSAQERSMETYIPMELTRGVVTETTGYGTQRSGSQLTMTEGEQTTIGMLDAGKMEVKWAGDGYEITFDFTSEDGVPLKGTYSGNIDVTSYNNTATDPNYYIMTPWTTLTGDYVLESFADDCIGLAMRYGNYLYPDYGAWCLYVDSENGKNSNTIICEVVTDINAEMVPEGTYNIGYTAGEFVAFPGTKAYGGGTLYAWVGDTTPDSDGYSSVMAPLMEGTITFTKAEGEYNYTISVDAKDELGNKITGEWTGMFYLEDIRGELGTI